MSKKNRTLILMVIALFLGYLPWYNFSAVLKYIAADFSLSPTDTGLIMSAFQLGYVIVVLITGWLADRIGPKKVVAWATLL
ncbi:MAG TPA: MFS transporter, partial [Syntrophomonadaceae bacterium]|nr:MFS transporter [Syntrophomonadaceae bacterium]